ncbi:MAG: alpha-ketoglutarate-dependent dioxygenase AlkB [Bacteroidales bacterium]|jgi:alkylated DNA repair dioxygenase AlkB|nr:alpha-ketoglutarate-dependent dioxygenase AlkB [Bacteroidales bacterium]|tara:strand:- start:7318 stop:7929 length:612 start_codon:yes stop_codon:yes gene_type:complete
MSQNSLFHKNPQPERIKIRNGELLFIPSFLNLQNATKYYNALEKNIEWKQEQLKIYGKVINFPRLTAWYGDSESIYSYSGLTFHPHPWTKELIKLKNLIEPIGKTKFNSVLLNLYRSGSDSMSWHTDAEKELGLNPVIASLNLGEERVFQLRHNLTKEKINIPLINGSLLIMQGELQHHWQHQIPKTKKLKGKRINLTFRLIK